MWFLMLQNGEACESTFLLKTCSSMNWNISALVLISLKMFACLFLGKTDRYNVWVTGRHRSNGFPPIALSFWCNPMRWLGKLPSIYRPEGVIECVPCDAPECHPGYPQLGALCFVGWTPGTTLTRINLCKVDGSIFPILQFSKAVQDSQQMATDIWFWSHSLFFNNYLAV